MTVDLVVVKIRSGMTKARKGTGLDRKLPAKREVNEMINASVKDPPEDCRDYPVDRNLET